ncbi:DnaJ C-terminal domain-containing protein [Nannocystis bainbridge]|uniref:DnaJ C-terminal domain-containing protein n=1 Tax=Nannocystis bainbridge TaxID=2995303 RepID=A0ABT5EB94_9BACT|nr:DnaJ C-terminal domain-containing protein [Nannocystis bainbridge]MDC0723146.1 DnaJ C-terminal domain-containing protein [Nannocystis bainbridge]
MRDLYVVLGIDRHADARAIKRAYRERTRRFHPDVNGGRSWSEELYREIVDAYTILGDDRTRALYDEFGELSLTRGFDPQRARAARSRPHDGPPGPPWAAPRRDSAEHTPPASGGDLEFDDLKHARRTVFDDILARIWRGREVRLDDSADAHANIDDKINETGDDDLDDDDLDDDDDDDLDDDLDDDDDDLDDDASDDLEDDEGMGRDARAEVTVPLARAVVGCTAQVRVGGRIVDVAVPAGTSDGAVVRLPGQGEPGSPPGDLRVTIRVAPEPGLTRRGLDLNLAVAVTLLELYRGDAVEVVTPRGTVRVRIPPACAPDHKLRLRRQGVPGPRGEVGDLYLEFRVQLPAPGDAGLLQALERLQSGARPRA